jgi:hypothetical protein
MVINNIELGYVIKRKIFKGYFIVDCQSQKKYQVMPDICATYLRKNPCGPS